MRSHINTQWSSWHLYPDAGDYSWAVRGPQPLTYIKKAQYMRPELLLFTIYTHPYRHSLTWVPFSSRHKLWVTICPVSSSLFSPIKLPLSKVVVHRLTGLTRLGQQIEVWIGPLCLFAVSVPQL